MSERLIRAGSEAFNKAIPFVMRWEGGYVNHPSDPGGETNFGISKRAFPLLNIKELTEKDAHGIYYFNYWRPLNLDDLPFDLACSMFDAAVNCGVQRVRRWYSELGGLVREGKENLSADEFNDRRQAYYDLLTMQDRFQPFKNGWNNRLRALREFVK